MEATPAEAPPRPVGGVGLEIAAAAGLSAAAFALFLTFPIIGAIGLPLAGVAPVRLAHRRGTIAAIVAASLAGAVVAAVALAAGEASAGARGALAAAVAIVPAIFAAFSKRTGRPSTAYLLLCVSGGVLLALLFVADAAGSGKSVGDEIAREFDRMMPSAIESYSRSGMDSATVARMRATLEAAREFSRRYWAGLLGLLWVLCAAVSFYAGARLARPAPSAEAARFEDLRVPAGVAPLFVAAGAASVFLAAPWKPAAGSVLLPLLALYFVAGLSIICHFARRWFRFWLLRVGVYTLVAYFPMNVGVALLGLFDWYVDFRRKRLGAMEKR